MQVIDSTWSNFWRHPATEAMEKKRHWILLQKPKQMNLCFKSNLKDLIVDLQVSIMPHPLYLFSTIKCFFMTKYQRYWNIPFSPSYSSHYFSLECLRARQVASRELRQGSDTRPHTTSMQLLFFNTTRLFVFQIFMCAFFSGKVGAWGAGGV